MSSQSHESALLLSSPSGLGLDQTCTSRSSEASGVPEAARTAAPSPSSSLVVKEEPCDVDAVLIKWEMCEERPAERHGGVASPSQHQHSPCGTSRVHNLSIIHFSDAIYVSLQTVFNGCSCLILV